MTLPPGLTEKDFSDAVKEFTEAVGKEWVFTNDEDLRTYRDPFTPFRDRPEEPLTSAAVGPDNVEQVQKVVKVANKYRIPLWVISTGKNFGYGGPAPSVRGSVVLDLKRMNRILEVSEKHAYALVEPGVSFFDLYRYIQEKGIKLWLDVPAPGWGSVVANTIDRGDGYTPYGDRLNFQCGMEVVLPNGEVMRTGMGAVPGAETWQQYKWGFGPHIDGLFFMTNYGIVTKMGIWLMPEPPAFLSCWVKVPRHEDIIPMIDILRPLRQSGIMASAMNFGHSPGATDDPNNLGGWRFRAGFYGLEKVTDLHWEYVRDQYSAIPGVEFGSRRFTRPYDPEKMDTDDDTRLAGIPTLRDGIARGFHPFFFSQLIPFSGEAAWNAIQLFDKISREYGRRFFGSFFSHCQRSLMISLNAPASKDDPKVNQTSIELARRMIAEAAKQGWGTNRMAVGFMDEGMAAYSYNNNALLRFDETLKDALDPNGILAPGKNGIWPKQMRERKQ